MPMGNLEIAPNPENARNIINTTDWKLACGGLFQDSEEEEENVITYPHLRILPITSADNPRNISPQFTRLNIRILPAVCLSCQFRGCRTVLCIFYRIFGTNISKVIVVYWSVQGCIQV